MINYRHVPRVTVTALHGPGAYALSTSFELSAHLNRLGVMNYGIPRSSMRSIIRVVAEETGVSVGDLLGAGRSRHVAWPRHRAMYEMYATGRFSLSQIGEFLGGRDHTTVFHGCRGHAKRNGLPQIVGRR